MAGTSAPTTVLGEGGSEQIFGGIDLLVLSHRLHEEYFLT